MGHALESTVAPYFVHSALVSMQAPCWHQPCRLAPQRSVGVLNAHCPSQHSPLQSAPAASWHVVASQHAELSSHASPTSTTPLPHVAPTLVVIVSYS